PARRRGQEASAATTACHMATGRGRRSLRRRQRSGGWAYEVPGGVSCARPTLGTPLGRSEKRAPARAKPHGTGGRLTTGPTAGRKGSEAGLWGAPRLVSHRAGSGIVPVTVHSSRRTGKC